MSKYIYLCDNFPYLIFFPQILDFTIKKDGQKECKWVILKKDTSVSDCISISIFY
jgi:hypothetical protein